MSVKDYYNRFYAALNLDTEESGSSFNEIKNLFLEEKEKMKILDIGCGAGTISEPLVRKGHEVYGIDIMQEAVERARKKGIKAEVFNLNEGKLLYEDEFFDVVFALDVIEHIFDPEKIIKEIYRVLKKKGYFIVSFPNYFDLIQKINIFFGKGIVHWEHRHLDYNVWNYCHIRFPLLKEIKEVLLNTGFKIEKIEFKPQIWHPVFRFTPLRFLSVRRFLANFMPQLFSYNFLSRCRK